MGFIKIYSKTEITRDSFLPWIRLDYKCEDEDSVFYPEPTYEYFYEIDDEEETEGDFIENLHWIYGHLDGLGIEYDYNIENGEWKNPDHPKYREGYECALAENVC